MESLLYTALALITSVGSATLAYVIMDARLRVAVGEERSRSAAAQTEQMRRVLELVVSKERPGPQSYGEVLGAGALLDDYPGLCWVSPGEASVFAILPPGSIAANAGLATSMGADEAPFDVVSDDDRGSGRPRHRFTMLAATSVDQKNGLVPNAGMIRRPFRHRGWRGRPRIR